MVLPRELSASPSVQPLEQGRPMLWMPRIEAGPDPFAKLI
jgi:hypothetical protein